MMNRICRRCGTLNEEGTAFCISCGSRLPSETGIKAFAAVLSTVTTVMFCFFGYLFISRVGFYLPSYSRSIESSGGGGGGGGAWTTSARQPDPTGAPEPQATDIPAPPTEVPEPPNDPAPTQRTSQGDIVITDNMLIDFIDAVYNFKCAYPADFLEYDGYGDALYAVASADRSAIEIINAEPYDGRNISELCDEYIRTHDGITDRHSVYSNSFTVLIHNGVMDYYKYCEIKNGNIYWFEFISPSNSEQVYSAYIQRIRESFIIY